MAKEDLAAALLQGQRVARRLVSLDSADERLSHLRLGLRNEVCCLLVALRQDIFFFLLGCDFFRQVLHLSNKLVVLPHGGRQSLCGRAQQILIVQERHLFGYGNSDLAVPSIYVGQ